MKKYFLDIHYISDFYSFSSINNIVKELNNPKYLESTPVSVFTTYHYCDQQYLFVTNFELIKIYAYLDQVCDVCGFSHNQFTDGLTFDNLFEFMLALDAAYISYNIIGQEIENAIERDSKSLNVIDKDLMLMLESDDPEINNLAKELIVNKYLK